MLIEHQGKRPRVDPSAHVAPTATLVGDVRIGADTVVSHGTVITAEGGPATLGGACVVMENAVLRGTRHHPLSVGDNVLIGPHAMLVGCTVEDSCFVATGAAVFNGAVLEHASQVRIHGVVHIKTRLAAGAFVPIGWVAVGDPAKILPPDRHDEIWEEQARLDFPGTVFGVDAEHLSLIHISEPTRPY